MKLRTFFRTIAAALASVPFIGWVKKRRYQHPSYLEPRTFRVNQFHCSLEEMVKTFPNSVYTNVARDDEGREYFQHGNSETRHYFDERPEPPAQQIRESAMKQFTVRA